MRTIILVPNLPMHYIIIITPNNNKINPAGGITSGSTITPSLIPRLSLPYVPYYKS